MLTKNLRIYILAICLVGIIISPASAGGNSCKKETGKYGGIAGTSSCPPSGTHIDKCLSEYYDMSVASGCGVKYFFVGGYWFTSKEMLGIPQYCIDHNMSPYEYDKCKDKLEDKGDYNDDGNPDNGNGCPQVPAPISSGIMAGFVGFAALIWKKIE